MGLLATLFGRRTGQPSGAARSRLADLTRDQTRKELLAMAVRDTLRRHGIAPGSIVAEGVPGSAPGRVSGIHMMLVFRQWQPGLLPYVVALEQAVRARLSRLDPLSSSWLVGVSWRFEPGEARQWPQLPTAARANPSPAQPQPAAAAPSRPPGPKKDIEQLLGAGDAAFAKRGSHDDFSPTLPMQNSQPVA